MLETTGESALNVLIWTGLLLGLPGKLLLVGELLALVRAQSALRRARHGGVDGFPGPVTVLVAFRDEEAVLPELFKALREQNPVQGGFRLVLVDDGSTDAGPTRVRMELPAFPGSLLLRNPGRGKTAALAHGLESIPEGIVVYTDADCRPEPGWIAGHLAEHSRGARVVLGHVVIPEPRIAALESLLASAQVQAGCLVGRPPFARGGNWSLHAADLRTVGGYAGLEGLGSGDDIYLLQKLVSQGLPCRFLAAAGTRVHTRAPFRSGQRTQQRRRRYGKLPGLKGWQRWRHLLLGSAFLSLLLEGLAGLAGHASWAGPELLAFWALAWWALDRSARGLGERRLRPDLPWLLPLWPILLLYYSLLGTLGGYRWKADPGPGPRLQEDS